MRLNRRECGASTLAYVVMLPMFVALLFGTFQIFKLIHMKQELSRATYLGARQLANETGFLWQGQADALARAEDIIYDNLRRGEGFIAREFVRQDVALKPNLSVKFDMDPLAGKNIERQGATSLVFEIEASVKLPWTLIIPFAPSSIKRESLQVSARHVGAFTHPRYTYIGRKPARDPETGWYASPLPTFTPVRSPAEP